MAARCHLLRMWQGVPRPAADAWHGHACHCGHVAALVMAAMCPGSRMGTCASSVRDVGPPPSLHM
eukprot:362523-Chlamydomonas_euryale.AAC.4